MRKTGKAGEEFSFSSHHWENHAGKVEINSLCMLNFLEMSLKIFLQS